MKGTRAASLCGWAVASLAKRKRKKKKAVHLPPELLEGVGRPPDYLQDMVYQDRAKPWCTNFSKGQILLGPLPFRLLPILREGNIPNLGKWDTEGLFPSLRLPRQRFPAVLPNTHRPALLSISQN